MIEKVNCKKCKHYIKTYDLCNPLNKYYPWIPENHTEDNKCKYFERKKNWIQRLIRRIKP